MIFNGLRIFLIFVVLMSVGCGNKNSSAQPSFAGAFMNAMPPGQSTAAAYGVLENPTENDLVINYISSPAADSVEVHQMIHEDGMMKMRPVNHLRVERKSKVILEPGSYHLMFMGVNQTLSKGEKIPLTIEFEKGITLAVSVEIK